MKPAPDASASTLNTARWIAALVVVISHLNGRSIAPWLDVPVEARTLLFKAWAFAVSFGNQAVMVFFVLSGFLVGGSLMKEPLSVVALQRYAIARVSRLTAVVVPALLLTMLADGLSGWLLPAGSVQAREGLPPVSAGALACNFAYLQTVWCEPLGSNFPLWTLACEAWYYVMFPLLWVAWHGRQHPRGAVVAVLVLAALLGMFLTHQVGAHRLLSYFHIWLLGAWASTCTRAWPRGWRVVHPAWAWLVFAGVLIGTRLAFSFSLWWKPGIGEVLSTVVALPFAWALVASRCAGAGAPAPRGADLHRRLADLSFSLYAIHMPLIALGMNLLMAAGLADYRAQPGLAGWGVTLGLFAALLMLSGLFHAAFERQTPRLRAWLLRVLLPGRGGSGR